ncbi:MAG: NAD(P)H-dependent glycerol-3-phosphate dehydrogenase [Bacillota bacterium]|nr:NAD(P)-dependent glycerol-3-phosphate dehydrogenase [Candidatus Fermentithermobacillaceae bacterium]
MKKACVIVAGAWGTALAVILLDNGYRPVLWDRNPEAVRAINEENRCLKLPGVSIPKEFTATNDWREALSGASMVVSAAPSTAVSQLSASMAHSVPEDALFVSATKGFDPETLRRPTQIWLDANPSLSDRLVALSGPNFAVEIANRLPAATTVASASTVAALGAQTAFMTPYLRVYTSEDVAGVELGGALKNIIAIACGMVEGMGLGYNAQAAIISRGIAELTRLGVALGAYPLTFAGLSGVGDLVLTSTGHLSRNRQAGIAVGKGEPIRSFIERTGYTVEGLTTVRSAVTLAGRLGISMPISEIVYRVLYEDLPVRQALSAVMSRQKRSEREF